MSFRSSIKIFVQGQYENDVVIVYIPKDMMEYEFDLIEEIRNAIDEGLIGSWTKNYYWNHEKSEKYYFLEGMTAEEYKNLVIQ